MLILAGRKKKVNEVNTKLDMLPRSTWWKEGPKSKVPWDIQVWFFVIIEVHGIDFNSLVLILLIYLWERKKLVHLFYPHFLDAYVLPILTISSHLLVKKDIISFWHYLSFLHYFYNCIIKTPPPFFELHCCCIMTWHWASQTICKSLQFILFASYHSVLSIGSFTRL